MSSWNVAQPWNEKSLVSLVEANEPRAQATASMVGAVPQTLLAALIIIYDF